MLNGCAYILTVDVGNTFIRFGLFAEDSAAAQECPLATCEITTPSSITADEARMRLVQVMAALAADAGMPGALVPAAAVLSCVVPALERPWKTALSRTCTGRVLTVGPGLKTGMPILYENPREVGADRIVNTLAAHHLHGGPAVVVDFGTSTNLDVVSAKGEFLGGALAPGIEISLDALAQRAAQLRKVELVPPRSVIGKNTVEALQSGALYGFAGQVDNLVQLIGEEIGSPLSAVIATGGLAPIVVPESRTITVHEPDLTLVGLRLVYEKNI